MNRYPFDYRNGELFWKERPVTDFVNKRACMAWHTRFVGNKAGNKVRRKESATEYWCVCLNGKKHYAHRIIWKMHYGEIPEGKQIDHIDQNGLNNRIQNLRLVCQSQNNKNKPRLKNNTSKFTGVAKAANGRWRAYIGEQEKQVFLGIFQTKQEAVIARKKGEEIRGFHLNHGGACQ